MKQARGLFADVENKTASFIQEVGTSVLKHIALGKEERPFSRLPGAMGMRENAMGTKGDAISKHKEPCFLRDPAFSKRSAASFHDSIALQSFEIASGDE